MHAQTTLPNDQSGNRRQQLRPRCCHLANSNKHNVIRYGRLTCAQKLTRLAAQSSERHRNEKNKEKAKTE